MFSLRSGSNTGEEQYIYHLDLYRLKKIEEALDIGIEEYLYSGRYCLIEWPELIEPLLPEETVRINIEIIEDSARKILFLLGIG
jgi:tRNA threonylcarbamoyladenosine biosynthesis protein TsaE